MTARIAHVLAVALATLGTAAIASAMVVVHAPSAELHLEVAATPQQQERGLMYRTSLPAHTGMLFVFAADAPVAFWMKNTLIALDMVFVAGDGTVRRVYAGVAPAPATMPDQRIPTETGQAKYVIELPAGEARADGIAPGVKLAIPDPPDS